MDKYTQGFIDGLKCFAWWKDGVEYVGTSGTTLKEATDQVENSWNFNPKDDEGED